MNILFIHQNFPGQFMNMNNRGHGFLVKSPRETLIKSIFVAAHGRNSLIYRVT